MKTKILIMVAFVMATFNVRPQIYLVDTNTPHVVGGSIIYGDPLPTAFTKVNLSLTWLSDFCATNQATNTALALAIGTLKTNFNTLSNSFVVVSNLFSARFSGTNLYNASVNSNKFDSITLAWLNAIGWTQILNGTNLQSGTVNSNKLDADTLTWLQSIPIVSGSDITNLIYSVGLDLTNQLAATGLDLTNRLDALQQAGTSGSETVFKAQSPDATVWYFHVSNLGILTITTSP